MSSVAARPFNLARVEGADFYTAAECVLKALLESELPIRQLLGPRRGPLPGVFELAAEERTAGLLREHGVSVVAVPDAARAVALAGQAALSGTRAVAMVPNDDLDAAMPALERLSRARLPGEGAACLLLEDHPAVAPASCPRRAMLRLDLPCIEPSTPEELRDSIEHAMRLSRAAERPVGVVAHVSLLRTSETFEAHPNRVVSTIDLAVAMNWRRQRPRLGDVLDLLRLARRLELNAAESMPSPGERAPLGFVAVGAARRAVQHLLEELRLAGRVPVLHLGLLHPLDEATLERALARCEHVIVLEPRPGAMGPMVAAMTERLRRRGVEAGSLWWDALPPDPRRESEAGRDPTREPARDSQREGLRDAVRDPSRDLPKDPMGDPGRLLIDDALRPSALARKTLHLLHGIRPGLKVASRLAAVDEAAAAAPSLPRSYLDGPGSAMAAVRELLDELDRWARRRTGPPEDAMEATALAMEGVDPPDLRSPTPEERRRLVPVELWDRRRFAREGDPDPERLARAAVPGERGERARIESATLADRLALRDKLREAVAREGLTVLVVRAAPPRLAGESSLAEVDRLGFQPVQRLVWTAELACDLRPRLPRSEEEAGGSAALAPLGHQLRAERVGVAGFPRIRLRPLLEQIEVVRTRPPAHRWAVDLAARLAPPRPEHGSRGLWRAHLAGFRGRAPGVATEALCEAGRFMGYRVASIYDPTSIGPGRRAWAQVLFTRPREDEPPPPLTPQIPYGEADLLLGLDPVEALRAIGADPFLRVAAADRTTAVVNGAPLDDQLDADLGELLRGLPEALGRTCLAERFFVDDIAGACRANFLTDRVADLVLLGMAYQRGLIPVSVEAIEQAVRRLEQRGVGRASEAFLFGRHMAADQRLAVRRGDERAESVERLVRRAELDLRHQRWRRPVRTAEFMALLRESLAAMPQLAATEEGREASRDFVLAMRRCAAWGGFDYARRYAELVVGLHRADEADPTRALTRLAILPLADAMLVRDLVYMGAMATSLDHRRRLRQRLGIRVARGDELQRRYLNRLDVMAFGWRVRIDFRTSDWPARMISIAGRALPLRWRGDAAERRVRAYVMDLVRRATEEAPRAPRRWLEIMRRLHAQAEASRLRGVAVEELRARVEADAPAV